MDSVDQMSRRGAGLALFGIAVLLGGCASVADGAGWPEVQAPADAPGPQEGDPQLVRGDDGLAYGVGDFEETPEAGQTVFGRYDGQWPLEGMERPTLFAGEVVERHSEGVVRVHPTYQFPETDLEGLAVDVVGDRGDETMGKGIGDIQTIDDLDGVAHIETTLGPSEGVQEGDMYGVVAPFDGGEAAGGQLTRRLRGVCMIVEADNDASSCRIHQGHPSHPGWGDLDEDHEMIFLEPSFGQPPREGTVKVARVGDDEIDDWMVDHLDSYLQGVPGGDVGVELVDEDADATDENFHRWSRRLETGDEPTIFVGANLEDDQLVLNYTGIGTAAGPGMVAAPPEGGVEMGSVDDIDEADWRGFGAVVMGAMMVYRGQTAEALGYLHQALRDEGLTGPWRWHSRDQYAMRWGAVDRFEEAMWLVHEDEAVAGDDVQARNNAVGTRVRLHDYLEQHERAAEVADKYLEWRRDDESGSGYLSALAMYAEMIVQLDDVDAATETVDEILERCPDGCQGDVIPLLAGIYWAATDVSSELQDDIVETMVRVGEDESMSSLASARMFQGWTFMRDNDYDQALIAFLEAERLFEEREDSPYGASRAQFYISLTQVARDEPQEAYDYGMQAREYMTEIGDYQSVARIYERLAEIYVEVDTAGPPEEFMLAGGEILQSGLQTQLGTGDYGRAAEAGFGYGHFMFRSGNLEEARFSLQTAVTRAIRVARFDMVAMSHIFLAIIARAEGNMELFYDELDRAETMAEIVDDPQIYELLEELDESQQREEPDDDPTQLL